MSQYKYNRIKAVLAELDMTEKELAEKLGVVKQTVSAWCTNNSQPSFERLHEIARLLSVEYVLLLEIPPKLKR